MKKIVIPGFIRFYNWEENLHENLTDSVRKSVIEKIPDTQVLLLDAAHFHILLLLLPHDIHIFAIILYTN